MGKIIPALFLSFGLVVFSASAQSQEPYKVGSGVSAPVPTYQPEPEMSDQARATGATGTVRISCVVDANGVPTNIVVTRYLGSGLDEKAIEAISKWRFKPGMKDGKAVPVQVMIDVGFHFAGKPDKQ